MSSAENGRLVPSSMCECWRCPECGAISDKRWHMQEHRNRGEDGFFSGRMCTGGGPRGENAQHLFALSAALVDAELGVPQRPTPRDSCTDPTHRYCGCLRTTPQDETPRA